ncbi:arginase family protein [Leifsonia sp. McL0607]|uniref:arginase family protein n=1 Tax=Leifsonia sp. McL0607 TaxID=3415672 RepID=UPI003CEC3DD4
MTTKQSASWSPFSTEARPTLKRPAFGFAGASFRAEAAATHVEEATTALIGVPSSLGSAYAGTENGPYFLRTASRRYTWGHESGRVLTAEGRRDPLRGVVDLGDLDVSHGSLDQLTLDISTLVSELPRTVIPVVIGGDHSVTEGVVRGIVERGCAPFRVLQFDQHLDLQLWPAATDELLDPLFNTNVMSRVGAVLGEQSIVHVGVDPFVVVDGEPRDNEQWFRWSRTIVSADSGALRSDAEFLDVVGAGIPTYISVDLDVLDSVYLSSTAYPNHSGMSPNQLVHLIGLVVRHNPIVGLDVVEFGAPAAARDPKTLADATRAADVLLHVLRLLTDEERLRLP